MKAAIKMLRTVRRYATPLAEYIKNNRVISAAMKHNVSQAVFGIVGLRNILNNMKACRKAGFAMERMPSATQAKPTRSSEARNLGGGAEKRLEGDLGWIHIPPSRKRMPAKVDPKGSQRKEEKNKGRKSVDVRNKESERRGLEMVRETSLTGQQKRSTNGHLAGVEKEVEGETGQRKGMRRLGRLDKDKEANRNTEREREQRIMELEAEWERWEKRRSGGRDKGEGGPKPKRRSRRERT